MLLDRLKTGIISHPDVMLAEPDSSEIRPALIMLKNQSQNLFQSYNYRPGDNITLINKVYTRNIGESNIQNIHVVLSESTDLISGETILGSDKLLKFYRNKNPNPNPNVNEITTNELIDFAIMHGCSRILILDFACDVCKDYFTDDVVSRDIVMKCRNDIREGKFARGGRRHRNLKRTNKISKIPKKQNNKRSNKTKTKKSF
jgi:hypothetical protein